MELLYHLMKKEGWAWRQCTSAKVADNGIRETKIYNDLQIVIFPYVGRISCMVNSISTKVYKSGGKKNKLLGSENR